MVTGAGGMIGSALPWGLKLSRAELDVGQLFTLTQKLDALRPEAILHLAALDIRQSERNPLLSMKVNVLGTLGLAEYARSRGVPFVFLSSAAVFNGPRGSVFFEEMPHDPVNIYGQTKHLAEVLIQKSCPGALIIRTGWVFGGHGAHHRKFVDDAVEKARAGAAIEATDQQQGSPTYVRDLVSVVAGLLEKCESGIWHVVNEGAATPVEIAEAIVGTLRSRSPITLRPNAHFQDGPARSASEVLGSRKIRLRSWREALIELIHAEA